jgi:Glycine transporter
MGLMVLAFATALGGGLLRDLLLGAVPPASLRDWRYPAVAFTGATIVFFLYPFVLRITQPALIVLDAAGLALFAVAGTQKALLYQLSGLVATLLGRSPRWAAERSETFFWPRCQKSCRPTYARPRLWPVRQFSLSQQNSASGPWSQHCWVGRSASCCGV